MRLSVTLALGPEVGWRQVKTGWMARRTKIVSSGLDGRPRLKKKQIEEDPQGWPLIYTCLHTLTHTLVWGKKETERQRQGTEGQNPSFHF